MTYIDLNMWSAEGVTNTVSVVTAPISVSLLIILRKPLHVLVHILRDLKDVV